MPSPSVPGSHAATKASLSASAESKISGRPENKIVTTGAPAALAFAISAASRRRQIQIFAVALRIRHKAFRPRQQ